MEQIITATYEDGVFKPDQPLNLTPGTRVRLIVQVLDEKEQAWQELQELLARVRINSGGERLTRDQLHERR